LYLNRNFNREGVPMKRNPECACGNPNCDFVATNKTTLNEAFAHRKPFKGGALMKLPGISQERTEEVKCLKCGRDFMSWDRKCNRICPDCDEANSRLGVCIGKYAGRWG